MFSADGICVRSDKVLHFHKHAVQRSHDAAQNEGQTTIKLRKEAGHLSQYHYGDLLLELRSRTLPQSPPAFPVCFRRPSPAPSPLESLHAPSRKIAVIRSPIARPRIRVCWMLSYRHRALACAFISAPGSFSSHAPYSGSHLLYCAQNLVFSGRVDLP